MSYNRKKPKIKKYIIEIILSLILVMLIFYVAVFMIAPKKVTNITGIGVYRVTSDSMSPKIKVNDTVVAHYANIDKVAEGDIIVFYTIVKGEEVRVTHYYSHIDANNRVITYRLDANNPNIKIYDRWFKNGKNHYVSPKDIIGQVSFGIPTSNVFNFISSSLGLAFLLLVVSSVFFFAKSKEEETLEQLPEFVFEY